MPKRLFYIALAYFISYPADAQMISSDTTIHGAAGGAIAIYYQSLGDQSPLYNGSDYLEYTSTIQEGHPFFESPTFTNGSIGFEGMEFRNVPLQYDMIKDQVIIQHYGKVYKINLPSEKIQWFSLSGHNFVNIEPDSSHQLKAGFYDRLYNGKIVLLVKREKKIREEQVSFQLNNVVDQKNYYYIKKEGLYYTFKNMHSLLSILKGKRKEIQQYLNKNKIKFKNNPEAAMLIAAEYYDRLTN